MLKNAFDKISDLLAAESEKYFKSVVKFLANKEEGDLANKELDLEVEILYFCVLSLSESVSSNLSSISLELTFCFLELLIFPESHLHSNISSFSESDFFEDNGIIKNLRSVSEKQIPLSF